MFYRREWFRWAVVAGLLVGLALVLMGGLHPAAFAQEVETGVGSVDDLDKQSPIQLWELISALFIPAIVQAIKRRDWDDETSRLALVSLSVAVAIIGSYLRDELSAALTITTAMKLVLLSYASYESILKMKGIAPLTAALGSLGKNAPSAEAQRAGYKGVTPKTPPPA